jgi:hypothetical protein
VEGAPLRRGVLAEPLLDGSKRGLGELQVLSQHRQLPPGVGPDRGAVAVSHCSLFVADFSVSMPYVRASFFASESDLV